MIISEIQSKRAHWSCYSSKFKAPADFSHHAILAKRLSLIIVVHEGKSKDKLLACFEKTTTRD